MKRSLPATVTTVIMICFMSAPPAHANLPNPTLPSGATRYWPSIPFQVKAGVPLGYYELCMKRNAICETRPGRVAKAEGGVVVLTEALRIQVEAINTSVNRGMRFVSDGTKDEWSVGGNRGDCEDFALTKKSKLLAAGLPSSALVIALGKTTSGVDHAVLVVRTDRGDLVLDNRAARVLAWSKSLYRWYSVQSPNDTWTWYRLG